MAVSGYSVLKTAFAGAKCGNYDMARYDGLVDETGWFFDPDNGNQATNMLPRGWLDRQPSPSMLTKLNVVGGQHDRWGIIRQWSSGDYDSPEMYPFTYSQMVGYNTSFIGHSQRNAYVGSTRPCDQCAPCYTSGDCETGCVQTFACASTLVCEAGCFPWQCELVAGSIPATYERYCRVGACGTCGWSNSLRAARHTFESIINTTSMPSRLAPWVQEFCPTLVNNHLDYYRGREQPFRDLLALMRSKNIGEIIFWTGDPGPGQSCAWDESELNIKLVWAPRVVGARAIQGIAPGTYDPLMLEYTLRKADGSDYTADILPDAMGYEATVLEVEFDGLIGFTRQVDYQVNVECTTGPDVEFGLVQALNLRHDDPTSEKAWHTLPVWECDNPDYPGWDCDDEPGQYLFETPDRSARRSFRLEDPQDALLKFVDDYGHLVLRLVHVGASSSTTPSRYDLVQVVPYSRVFGSGSDGPEMALQSDLNYDGVVETADMAIFLGSYAEGLPAADVDLDGTVGNGDVTRYMGDYASEAP